MSEVNAILDRYARRTEKDSRLYDPLNPDMFMSAQERDRAMHRWIHACGIGPVDRRRVLEIGCGTGRNLLDLLRFGFRPENLVGNELLPDRLTTAASVLPAGLTLIAGNAMDLRFEQEYFDIVLQSTVFSSIADDDFQRELARKMWSWIRPGGGVLWYDITYNNPRNPDVHGISLSAVRRLFPEGTVAWHERLALAPPISRIITRVHPFLYTVFNSLPPLRTNRLCWIVKTK